VQHKAKKRKRKRKRKEDIKHIKSSTAGSLTRWSQKGIRCKLCSSCHWTCWNRRHCLSIVLVLMTQDGVDWCDWTQDRYFRAGGRGDIGYYIGGSLSAVSTSLTEERVEISIDAGQKASTRDSGWDQLVESFSKSRGCRLHLCSRIVGRHVSDRHKADSRMRFHSVQCLVLISEPEPVASVESSTSRRRSGCSRGSGGGCLVWCSQRLIRYFVLRSGDEMVGVLVLVLVPALY